MKKYSEYYKECRLHKNNSKLYDFKFNVSENNHTGGESLLSFPNNYRDTIDSASKTFNNLISDDKNLALHRNPKIDFGIRLKNISEFDELNTIADIFIPQVESKIYDCNLFVEGVYCYRNVHRNAQLRSSWIWHYDNDPKEYLKIMIYLTDVCENSGPLGILLDQNNQAIKMKTGKVDYSSWEVRNSRFGNDFVKPNKTHRVVGKKGLVCLFDSNIVHRAEVPKPGYHRDVIVFYMKPSKKKVKQYINKKYCQSWGCHDGLSMPSKDPEYMLELI